MAEYNRKRVWGWFFYDWASQPYSTLILTFIFGPYINELIGDGTEAQAAWGYGVAAAGIIIALLAPVLGAIADGSGNRMRWIWVFSACYVVGAGMLWTAAPDNFNLIATMAFFGLGLIGMEFTTIFTNSFLPDMGPREKLGSISGNGWAFGYAGGLIALLIMLALLAESPTTGKTMIDLDPLFGLDASAREGTRAVGPLTAIWYAVFMIPFFLWVRETRQSVSGKAVVGPALRQLGGTLRRLPKTQSLFAYLTSSMFYRDALNGMYTFGGIYAGGVLGWGTIDVGIFGILAIVFGAFFAWLGGIYDERIGPKPVIRFCIIVLLLVAITTVTVSRESVLMIPVAEGSKLPDITFYVLGCVIGAAGGVLGSASRTMMVRQANPDRMTEAFGLYALSGKATSFLAPLLIGVATSVSGSQQIGVSPLIVLFLIGLVLLTWVQPDGDHTKWDDSSL